MVLQEIAISSIFVLRKLYNIQIFVTYYVIFNIYRYVIGNL